jgi:hypothetical protein
VVEVAARVDRLGALAGLRAVLQQEELDLRVGVEGEPHVGALGEGALEHPARVGVRRRAVGHEDVAEDASGAGRLAAPRQDLEGRRVRLGEHVGLVDAGEALDGRAVEAHALGEGAFELGWRDGDGFEETEHIGEPEPDEPDVAFLKCAEHELLLAVHGVPS